MSLIVRDFLPDTSGATAIEYCLIAAFVFLAIVAAVGQVGSSLVPKYQSVEAGLN